MTEPWGVKIEESRARPVTPDADAGIGVLMAVYNGGAVLAEQLDSIAQQDFDNWTLLASDDGSTDDSVATLTAFREDMARKGRRVVCLTGPGEGAAPNFLSLVRAMGTYLPAGSWLAFSDQDDVWMPDRLSRGRMALEALPDDRPALYCSRTLITDHALASRRISAPRPRPACFCNALVQNIASGNTILLNPKAAALVMAAAQEVGEIVVHDWWIYQLVTGAGGHVVHDDEPTLLYRQHAGNQIGANDQLFARLKRIRQLLRGDFVDWNTINLAALRASAHRLTPENRARLEAFGAMRAASLPSRLRQLARLRLYRQSRGAHYALWLAAVLGRL